MSFFVCLPSNACPVQFPKNTQSNFSTILRKPISLSDGDYEVALTEIIFSPKILANFGDLKFDDFSIQLRLLNGLFTKDLACLLNKAIFEFFKEQENEESFNRKIFEGKIPLFSIENDLFFFSSGPPEIKFFGSISMILKQQKDCLVKKGEKIKIGDNQLSVTSYASVYSNIIDEQFFGDTLAPLLRCFYLGGETSSKPIVLGFDNPIYVPVNKREISTINIQIADLEGHFIQFKDIFSFVIATLHFRKKNNAAWRNNNV